MTSGVFINSQRNVYVLLFAYIYIYIIYIASTGFAFHFFCLFFSKVQGVLIKSYFNSYVAVFTV